MRRIVLIVCTAMLASCGDGKPAARKLSIPAGFALKSASIALPADAASLPPAAAIVTEHCTGCHSAEMITAQPPLDAAKWQAEIDKMRTVFKAPIDPAVDPRLIAALGALPSQNGQP